MAPTGMEGLFFAISSARAILGPVSDMLMGAMNDKYNTNCPECRDSYGHFCDTVMVNNDINGDGAPTATQCAYLSKRSAIYILIINNNRVQQHVCSVPRGLPQIHRRFGIFSWLLASQHRYVYGSSYHSCEVLVLEMTITMDYFE